MPKKLTQEEAEAKSLAVGVKMVGPYLGGNVPTKFQCPYCPNIFLAKPYNVFCKDTKSCGCFRFRAYNRKTLIGQKFGKLTVIEYAYTKYKRAHWKCRCDCGKKLITCGKSLLNLGTKSCGCIRGKKQTLTQQDAENKSSSIGIVMVGKYTNSFTKTKFKCPNCNRIFMSRPNGIWSKNTKSCGNCQLNRNGKPTSYKALSLASLLPSTAIHNYQIGRYNVDYALVDKKIAIEYDEWFNHGHKLKEDAKRYNKLVKRGWYIIKILAHNNLPTQRQIDKALALIDAGHRKVSITLKGWGEGPTRKDIKKNKNISSKLDSVGVS